MIVKQMNAIKKAQATLGLMPSRRWTTQASTGLLRSPLRSILLSVLLCVNLFVFVAWQRGYGRNDLQNDMTEKLHNPYGQALTFELPIKSAERWAIIHEVFTAHDPGTRLGSSVHNAGKSEPYHERWKSCRRPETDVKISPEEVVKAKQVHADFVQQLPDMAQTFTYPKGSRGIVATTVGSGNAILLVSLKLLRETGCTLPVEVFVAKWHDYEPILCDKVYPSLNAKCVFLAEDVLDGPSVPNAEDLGGYQLKPFAILMSSFEQVLFIDADSFPIVNPELLFDSKPFTTTGLITWPDIWCASQSKQWYEVTGTYEVDERDRASSESGQIMYDKSTHIIDLLLTCYYNYYGPAIWWGLLSQHTMGEGDKETYINAADVMNATSWQVNQPPVTIPLAGGPGPAILQASPVIDFDLAQKGSGWRKGERAPMAFIHNHWPKADASALMTSDFDFLLKPARYWGPKEEIVEMLGRDWEHELWKATEWTACTTGVIFRAWKGRKPCCDWVREHIELVFEDNSGQL